MIQTYTIFLNMWQMERLASWKSRYYHHASPTGFTPQLGDVKSLCLSTLKLTPKKLSAQVPLPACMLLNILGDIKYFAVHYVSQMILTCLLLYCLRKIRIFFFWNSCLCLLNQTAWSIQCAFSHKVSLHWSLPLIGLWLELI